MEHGRLFHVHLSRAKSFFETGVQNSDIHAKIAAFDSMLFECARARRIARDAPDAVQGIAIDPTEFLGVMDEVAQLRNVMEHWGDVIRPREQQLHRHTTKQGLRVVVDESSIIIMGPEEIYKGQLNLHDVYTYIVAKLTQAKAQ